MVSKTIMAETEEEIKLRFLLCGSCEILPASYVKLRSYLNIHLTNVAYQSNLNVCKNFKKRNKTCLYCYSPWSGDTTFFKLFPSKKSKFSQAQHNADEQAKKKAQWNEMRNTLVLKCKVCSKKSSFSLIKKKPVEEVAKNEIMESVKKKKKKDKSCGLAVNLKRDGNPFPKNTISKKKKRKVKYNMKSAYIFCMHCYILTKDPEFVRRIKNFKEATPANPSPKNFQINQLSLMENKLNPLSNNAKNLMLNPYASQMQRRFSKKKDKKLQRLRKAVKEEKNLTRKSLKDFLTLI